MKQLARAGFWPTATLAYMACIYLLSSIPGGDAALPEDADGFTLYFIPPALQNLLHIPLYAGLAWLWHRTLGMARLTSTATVATAIIIAVGYGFLDELHQATVPGRYASATDVLLNALGAVAGGVISGYVRSRGQQIPTSS